MILMIFQGLFKKSGVVSVSEKEDDDHDDIHLLYIVFGGIL